MRNLEFNRGHEEANNFSALNNTGIHSPANSSYRQSLYIAAIAETLGCKGLVSPVVDVRDGTTYTFDFFQPEKVELFKIFRGFDEDEFYKYKEHAGRPSLIFDSEFIPCTVEPRMCGSILTSVLVIDPAVAELIHEYPFTFICHEGSLWSFQGEEDGRWLWEPIVPKVLNDYFSADPDE